MLIVLRRFIFETEKHNGIAELLEILGRSVTVETESFMLVKEAVQYYPPGIGLKC
jgi:hypothetical protein